MKHFGNEVALVYARDTGSKSHVVVACERGRISDCRFFPPLIISRRRETTAGNTSAFAG